MNIHTLNNKSILLLGYGVEGKATEKFLKVHCPGCSISIADINTNPELFQSQEDFDVVIRSPGVNKSLVTNKSYTTATNIFFANTRGKTIGITGTKGKSTTTALISHILKENGVRNHLVGNIGTPLLSEFRPNDENGLYVCELSSYQLDDIQYSPDIAVIVSLFPEHLTYHGSLENYYNAKRNILRFTNNNNLYIFNQKYEILQSWADQVKGTSRPYNTIPQLDEEKVPIKGAHNREDIQAAWTVARCFHLSDEKIMNAVYTFQPLPHRMQFVGTYQGISFYDDAISTAPESTVQAINTLKPIGTIFLGGENRGYDFSHLVDILSSNNVPNIVLFPDSGDAIATLISKKQGYSPKLMKTKSMEEAVQFAYQNTLHDSVCLLSTASPSYSVWHNFQEKGNLFQKFVKEYDKKTQNKKRTD